MANMEEICNEQENLFSLYLKIVLDQVVPMGKQFILIYITHWSGMSELT